MLNDRQGALNVFSMLEVVKDPGSAYTSKLSWSVRCHIWGRSRLHACGGWPCFLSGDVLYRKEIGVRVCFWVFPICMFLNVNSLNCQKILYPRRLTVEERPLCVAYKDLMNTCLDLSGEQGAADRRETPKVQAPAGNPGFFSCQAAFMKHPWSQPVIWALE